MIRSGDTFKKIFGSNLSFVIMFVLFQKNTGLERDTEGYKKGRKATKIKEGEVKETEKRKRQMLKETDAKRYRD